MAISVETGIGKRVLREGVNFLIEDDVLFVEDKDGENVAAFAKGTWRGVEKFQE